MITTEEVLKEKEYLKKVVEVLKDNIDNYESKVKSLSNNIQEQMSYAWDKTNRLSDTEFVYALANIQKRSVYAENANKKVTSYKKMLNNTYFARIDFDDGEEVLPIYIGIASLEHNDDFLVFDWRAPISSMFYNSEIGDASYTISTGDKITGKITLKRQYKISEGEIKEVFDTDMQIIDSVLKQMLSSNASHKMKNIVNTIQKEQNQIIRKNDVDVLVVQGPAGSGKTSVAMHKIAYLLYSERDKINNSNVMILSPNEIFNNYISDVLPDIGEDNVCQATYYEFAKAYINEFDISSKIEDAYEVIYSSKSRNKTEKYNEIKGDDSMEALVCSNCGANALIRKNDYMVCPYCDSRFAITREERRSLFGSSHHVALSHNDVDSSITLDDDVANLLRKCKSDPKNARKYANLVLDIDPDNEEALKYL